METLECKGREDDAMETGNAGDMECRRHIVLTRRRLMDTWNVGDIGCWRHGVLKT